MLLIEIEIRFVQMSLFLKNIASLHIRKQMKYRRVLVVFYEIEKDINNYLLMSFLEVF